MADGALEDIQATLASVAPAILLIKGINDSNGTAANAELVQKAQLVVNRVVLKLQASALAVDQSGRLSSRLWTIAGDDMTGVPNEEVWTLPVVVTDMDRDVLLSALENMSTLRTVFAGKRKAELDVDDEVAVVNNIKNSFGLAEGGDGVNDDLRGMFQKLGIDPIEMRKNKDLKTAADSIATGKPTGALVASASGEQIPHTLFDGGAVSNEIAVVDGKITIVTKTDASVSHYSWTRNINKLLDDMPSEDPRRLALVAYRDTMELLISNYGWADVSDFDRELKTIVSNGVAVEFNFSFLSNLFLLLWVKKNHTVPTRSGPSPRTQPTRDRPVPKPAAAREGLKGCHFFNTLDVEKGGHRCHRRVCKFPHTCSTCKSSKHGAHACTGDT